MAGQVVLLLKELLGTLIIGFLLKVIQNIVIESTVPPGHFEQLLVIPN